MPFSFLLLEAASETYIISYIPPGRIPNEADGYAGAGSGISGDACCRLRQQWDKLESHTIPDACSNPNPDPDLNPIVDTYTFSNSNPFTDTCAHTYPDPLCCRSGLGRSIQRPWRQC